MEYSFAPQNVRKCLQCLTFEFRQESFGESTSKIKDLMPDVFLEIWLLAQGNDLFNPNSSDPSLPQDIIEINQEDRNIFKRRILHSMFQEEKHEGFEKKIVSKTIKKRIRSNIIWKDSKNNKDLIMIKSLCYFIFYGISYLYSTYNPFQYSYHQQQTTKNQKIIKVYLKKSPEIFDIFTVTVSSIITPISPVYVHKGGEI